MMSFSIFCVIITRRYVCVMVQLSNDEWLESRAASFKLLCHSVAMCQLRSGPTQFCEISSLPFVQETEDPWAVLQTGGIYADHIRTLMWYKLEMRSSVTLLSRPLDYGMWGYKSRNTDKSVPNKPVSKQFIPLITRQTKYKNNTNQAKLFLGYLPKSFVHGLDEWPVNEWVRQVSGNIYGRHDIQHSCNDMNNNT